MTFVMRVFEVSSGRALAIGNQVFLAHLLGRKFAVFAGRCRIHSGGMVVWGAVRVSISLASSGTGK
jgi:hypothetical protein